VSPESIVARVLAGAIVGFLVGLTGLGGGVLLVPILISALGVPAIVAVGSDALVNAVTKVGAGIVHWRRGNVRWWLVVALIGGSIPGAALGVGILTRLHSTRGSGVNDFLKIAIAVLLIIIPVTYLAAKPFSSEVEIEALGEETFVAHIVESPYRQRVVQLFAKHRVPLRMDVELPTIESIKRFVEMKRGIAIVPRMCVEGELARGDLRELRIRQMRIQRHLYLVYRQDRPLSAAARGLVETILERKKSRSASARRGR